ncbi:MAG: MCE family protein [Pseudonocardiaceae bacterium]|nr:MCE family protein [Pseudonocardiaceae bacterium]
MNTAMSVIRRRLLGVGFIVVVSSLIAGSIAKYNEVFVDYVPVTLRADQVGNQLQERSDVKIRGVIVGKVSDIETTGDGATVALSMRPGMVDMIPSDVQARLLPKTLFGEKYVSLVAPAAPDVASRQSLQAGDVIAQDRSRTAIEVQQVLDSLLPLLEAVRPQDLASTLNAMSQTLEGRGDDVGETLVLLQRYLSQLNTELPDINADISGLADVTDTYSEAAPDLLAALEDFTVTSRTAVEQRENLSNLYATVTRASDDTTGFLEVNDDNLIALADTGRPTLEVLAKYAPEYPCLLGQLDGLVPRIDEVLGEGTDEPGAHFTVELIPDSRGPYRPGEEPEYSDQRGPYCVPAEVPGNHPQYPPGGPIEDGSDPPPAASARSGDDQPAQTRPQAANGFSLGLPNSAAEQRFVASLLSSANGTDPSEVPGWSTLLVGPLLRGSEVSLR